MPLPKQRYTVEWGYDSFPTICPYFGNKEEDSMTFEDAKAEIIDWLERELEAVKQMQEEEHLAEEETNWGPDQGQERQWWEDNVS